MISLSINRYQIVYILLVFMYIFSIIYIPIEVSGSSVSNKLIPIIIFFVICIYISSIILVKHLKEFFILFIFIISILISSSSSFISFIYTVNFTILLLYGILFYSMSKYYGIRFLNSYFKFIYIFSFVTVFFALLEYFFPSLVDSLFFLRGSIYSEKGQVSSLYSNPNVYGVMTALSIGIGYVVNKNNYKIFFLNLILLLGVVLSGSRMALLISLGIIFFNHIKLPFSSNKIINVSLILLVLISIFYASLSHLIDLNLRDVIWNGALNAFKEFPLFGVGLGQFQYEISNFTNITIKQSPNNLVFGFLSEIGIVSSIIFLFFIIMFSFKTSSNLDKKRIELDYKLAILMFFLIISQFSEYFFIYVSPYVLIFITTLVYIKVNKTIQKGKI